MRVLRLTLVALAAGVALAQPARAGLFEDDEARKAILELRGKVQANEDLANKRAEQLNTLIQDQIQPLRRSVLDLNAQIDALRAEIAKLRGTNEQLARDLELALRRLGIGERLPGVVLGDPVPGAGVGVDAEPTPPLRRGSSSGRRADRRRARATSGARSATVPSWWSSKPRRFEANAVAGRLRLFGAVAGARRQSRLASLPHGPRGAAVFRRRRPCMPQGAPTPCLCRGAARSRLASLLREAPGIWRFLPTCDGVRRRCRKTARVWGSPPACDGVGR